MTSSKDEIRAQLEALTQQYEGETITYAAQRKPDRNPWKRKPSLLDQAFSQELERISKDQKKDGQLTTEEETDYE